MKQLLSLFLFLLPCLAWAQYPSNGNQKITLGEQTTADGLIYRGVAADTTLTTKSDTAAYFVLDTVNINLYTYKASATGRKWRQLGADTAAIAYVNTYGTQTVNGLKTFKSTVNSGAPATSGSTVISNFTISNPFEILTNIGNNDNAPYGVWLQIQEKSTLGTSYPLSLQPNSGNVGIGTLNPTEKFVVSTAASGGNTNATFVSTDNTASTNLIVDVENSAGKRLQVTGFGGSASGNFLGTTRAGNSFVVKAGGKLGIGVDDDYDLFLAAGFTSGVKTMTIEQNGGFKFSTLAGTGSRTVEADVNGVITAPVSSINYKENVQTLDYGLNELLQINPVSFDYINKDKWGDERNLGFIVEDMFPVIPEVTGTMNNGDMYLDMTKLIPVLTKAIQEQNLLIKALEQRIINLENK